MPRDLLVLPGALDINDDGYPDFVDVDPTGGLWADLMRGDQEGSHDTQVVERRKKSREQTNETESSAITRRREGERQSDSQ